MHKDVVCFVVGRTLTGFVITASIDGHIKFWKKQDKGLEFTKGTLWSCGQSANVPPYDSSCCTPCVVSVSDEHWARINVQARHARAFPWERNEGPRTGSRQCTTARQREKTVIVVSIMTEAKKKPLVACCLSSKLHWCGDSSRPGHQRDFHVSALLCHSTPLDANHPSTAFDAIRRLPAKPGRACRGLTPVPCGASRQRGMAGRNPTMVVGRVLWRFFTCKNPQNKRCTFVAIVGRGPSCLA